MRVLELFSGTGSVGKVCKKTGFDVLSVDIDPSHAPDLNMDIMDFDETMYPTDAFQFIWASPPCEAYSVARTNVLGDREVDMQKADDLVRKTLEIVRYFGQASWCIENPATSRLWTRDVTIGLATHSVMPRSCCVTSYCSYGTRYRKNTRISNSIGLVLERCPGEGKCPSMVGSRHVECAQQGGVGAYGSKRHTRDELHSIPSGLVEEILSQVVKARDAAY